MKMPQTWTEEAFAYARKRWCWADTVLILELIEEKADNDDDPCEFIDWLAEKYGLIDYAPLCKRS